MINVYVFYGEIKLKQFVSQRDTNCQYIIVGEKTDFLKSILEHSLFSEIKLEFDTSFKNNFLKSYIDLIGIFGLKYNSIYWWVTQTSAKNQFGSPFFSNLYLFWSIISKLKEIHTDILIINPPEAIISSLNKYCHINSINFFIFYNHSLTYKPIKIIKNVLMDIVNKLYFIFKTANKKYISDKYFKQKFNKHILKNENYYVLRSWFYPRSIKPIYRDSFFGILPDYLIKRGEKLLIIAGIWEEYNTTAKKIAENNDYFIIPQEFFIDYLDIIRVVKNIYSNKIKITEEIMFKGLDISDILKSAIDSEFNGKQILDSYINFYYIKNLLNIVNVHTFLTTYENYPWEKMCFLSIKNKSPNTYIIGYQHSRLSLADLTMYLSENEKQIIPIPDKINTTGIITKNFLEEYGHYDKNIVKDCCALRSKEISKQPFERKRTNNVLLVLGGLPLRAISIVNFVYNALKNINIYQITLRCHPALSLNRFEKKLDFNISLWSNLIVSNNNEVTLDLEKADIVIYDASTISLEAISMGIPIIHIALDDIISFDPVIDCKHLKWIVKNEKELAKTIENIYQLNDNEYIKEQTMAREYVENYLHKVTDDRLAEFIMS